MIKVSACYAIAIKNKKKTAKTTHSLVTQKITFDWTSKPEPAKGKKSVLTSLQRKR